MSDRRERRFRLWALHAAAFQPQLLARLWSVDGDVVSCLCVGCNLKRPPDYDHLGVFAPPSPSGAHSSAEGFQALYGLKPIPGECWWALCEDCAAIQTPALEAECFAKVARIVEELTVEYAAPPKKQARFWRRVLG